MLAVLGALFANELARTSRGLLLGEAANPKVPAAIKQAIESHQKWNALSSC